MIRIKYFTFLSLPIFLLLIAFVGMAQMPTFRISNYNQRDYGRMQEAQNWAVVQDNLGLMYFGNANGVLEYDGNTWSFIPVKNGTYVTALACDSKNRIFVGTQQDFGYLTQDKKGQLVFKSLYNPEDQAMPQFSTIRKIYVNNKSIFFQSEEALFVYENDQIISIEPETSFHLSFLLNDELWIRQRESGLMKYQNGKTELLPNGNFFKDIGISAILPLHENKNLYLIISFNQGFYTYNAANGSIMNFIPKDRTILEGVDVFGAIRLSNGHIALNTSTGGVLIIDNSGKLIHHICEESGLQVNDVKQVIEDKHGNLWMALNNGISCVYYSSPYSIFGREAALSGNIYAIIRHNKLLFAGTSTGLFVQDKNSRFLKFVWAPAINKTIWGFIPVGDILWILSGEGLFSYKDGVIKQHNSLECRAGLFDEKSGILYIGGNHGLALFRLTEEASLIEFVEGIDESIVAMAKLPDSEELWLGTSFMGTIRLKTEQEEIKTITKYDVFDGLPESYVLPFVVNNKMLFATVKGLMSFVDEESVLKTLPDSLKDNPAFYRGYFELADIAGNSAEMAVTLAGRTDKTSLIVYNNKLHLLRDNELIYRQFNSIDIGKINALYLENNNLWIAADEALGHFDLSMLNRPFDAFNVRIRKIQGADTLIYTPFSQTLKRDILQLRYSRGRITFDFAAFFYDHTDKTSYSFILQAYDKDWSEWTNSSTVQYTNLKEGKYVFMVRAKNVFGEISETHSFEFKVLPPWYRTIWAMIVYTILAGLFIYLIVILSQRRLKQQNEKLEKIVAQRTEEISLERDKNEQLLLNTLPLKVVSDLKLYGKTEPEKFDNVTVYFSDVAGFTTLSTGLDPAFLISELNDIFTAFDDIMQECECERIKTIGDAYLAVCGMPQKNEKHAQNMIRAALKNIEYLKERNKKTEIQWHIRVGIHSGSVVGGIVGVKKYIYDVFGDTINTAARMESNGEPMRVNVSETSYYLVKEEFNFTKRQPMEIKGKGVMNMFFVENK